MTLRVLMISAEVHPFARTGGLGDVASGLAVALADGGVDVAVVTPLYGMSRIPPGGRWWPSSVDARIGWGPDDRVELGVLELAGDAHGRLRFFFLDHPILFARDGIYGDRHGTFGDNDIRFVALSRGALDLAERLWPATPERVSGPDVVHAHDWHATPAILTMKLTPGGACSRARTVLTIHNLAFQGVLGFDALDRLALPRAAWQDGTLAHEGHVNLMHGAIACADAVTTVSPSYSQEIRTPLGGFGLDALLRHHAAKVTGILNGIDMALWDPAHDGALERSYDARTADPAKEANARALASALGLGEGGPLLASIGRLSDQKGIDLLLSVLPSLVERGGRFVLVGTGEPHLEARLRHAADAHPGRVASVIAFDERLSRRVYAAADLFVVPSRYEPCGLTQIYAMRYGAIPIVTPVGGLLDTVEPIDSLWGRGTGFVASGVQDAALLVACEDAFTLLEDPIGRWEAVRRGMSKDSSWRGPAQDYLALYAELVDRRR